jgi:DNA-binding transcriptional LysR family regulator
MNRVGVTDLSVFLAVARHLSFRRAAVELGVTPSALSHALRALEERLDLRLVNRTTRSVALTEAGARLFARLTPAFRDIDDAMEDLNTLRGRPAGMIRINSARQAAHLALLPVVAPFLRQFPEVRLEIVVDEALSDIVAEGFDAGVRFGERIAADMIAVPIGPRQRSAVVASPEFFERHAMPQTPHDLRDLPCIRYRFHGGALYRWEFERGEEEIAVEVDGPLTLSAQDLMVQAALGGAGLAYVFEGQVRELLEAGRLLRVLEEWCPAYSGFYLYYPSRRQLPAALQAFVEFTRRPAAPASAPRRRG